MHYPIHDKCWQTLKAKLTKCALSCFLKAAESVTARRSAGSAFHTDGPACEKARLVRNCGIKKSDVDEDQRPQRGRPQSTGLTEFDT